MSSSLEHRRHAAITVARHSPTVRLPSVRLPAVLLPALLLPALLLPKHAHAQTEDPNSPAAPAAPEAEAPVTSGEAPVAADPAATAAEPTSTAEPTASADPSAQSTPKMDLSAPPPPPARTRKARVHNGFYLRGGFGAGGIWPKLTDHSDGERFDVDGGSVALGFDAMVGGSPADGFALGGAVSWLGGTSEISSDGADATVSLLMVGPFFDAFPNPKDGFHLGAMAGFAMHRISDHPSNVDRTMGFGGAAWLGYDWWVSDEISAGLMLRFNGALTSGDEGAGSLKANTMGLTVLATALYH